MQGDVGGFRWRSEGYMIPSPSYTEGIAQKERWEQEMYGYGVEGSCIHTTPRLIFLCYQKYRYGMWDHKKVARFEKTWYDPVKKRSPA